MVQKHGTAGIGKLFGPITAAVVPGDCRAGLCTSCAEPGGPGRHEPALRLSFIVDHPGTSFIILGAVVLCVTGGEALYADMGHFGKLPIRLAWFSWSCPA